MKTSLRPNLRLSLIHIYASEQTYFQLYSGMDLISTHKAVKRIYDCELPVGYAEAAVKKMVLVPNLREYLEKTGKPGEKYFILSKEPGRIEAIRQEMEKIPDMFVVRAHPYGIETMQKNVNKGTALRILREHLGLKKEQVLVMGDSENDLEMCIRDSCITLPGRRSRQP